MTQYGTLLFPWFSVCWWRLHDDEIPVCGDRSLFCAASALGRPSFAQGCTLVGSCFCCSSGGVSAFVLSSGISEVRGVPHFW